MNNKLKVASLIAALLFLSSAMVLSSEMISLPAAGVTETPSIPASTTGLGSRITPISILVYNQFADLAFEFPNTIEAISRTYGPQFEYENLTDYTNLASKLSDYDIFLIAEMETASMENMTTIGTAWASILSDYVTNGGNILMLDHRHSGLDAPGAHLYNETGLMSFTGVGDYTPGGGTLTNCYLTNSSNALAYGLPSSFGPSNGMISIQTTDGIVVVDDGTDAIVVQKIMGKGNIIYLGFDFYAATTEIDTIFGNALRLHSHIVFDDSHGQFIEIDDELSSFASDLIAARFAVSTIGQFDFDYLASCDVLVIPRSTTNYTNTEIDFIEEFVDEGGAVFVSTDYGGFGNYVDLVIERFGFVRNKTAPLVDTDDNLGDPGWIPFVGSNIHNHSVTVQVSRVEIYAGTGFIEMPANAFALITTDDDGTADWHNDGDANNTVVSAVSTYGMGRVGVFGDTDALYDNSDADGDAISNYLENAEFFKNLIRWLSAAGIEEKKVLFDASHGWNYFLYGSYRGLADLLTLNGYTLHWMSTFYPSFIDGMDVFVVEDGNTNYTESETDSIESYVNEGGSLLLLGGSGTYGVQVDTVGNRFGLDLNNTDYLVDTDDYLVSPEYVVYNASNFGNHPIIQGVTQIELHRATAFISTGSATTLVTTDNDGTSDWDDGSPADGLAVIVAKEHQMGRIVFSGSMHFLTHNQDPDADGVNTLYDGDNSVFILNTLTWLAENRAPIVEVTSPNGGETFNGTETITWTAVDYDGDPIHCSLYYSANGGSTWTALDTGLTATSYEWNTTTVDDGDQYLIRVIASDDVATGLDVSNGVFSIDNVPETTTTTTDLPLDPALLAIIAVVAIVAIIIVVVVMKKRGSK